MLPYTVEYQGASLYRSGRNTPSGRSTVSRPAAGDRNGGVVRPMSDGMPVIKCCGFASRRRLTLSSGGLAVIVLALACGSGCHDRVAPSSGAATNGSPGATGAGNPAIETLARFTDVAADSGVEFTYRDGQEAGHFAILESLGGGVALFDYDADGALDIFLPGGGKY